MFQHWLDPAKKIVKQLKGLYLFLLFSIKKFPSKRNKNLISRNFQKTNFSLGNRQKSLRNHIKVKLWKIKINTVHSLKKENKFHLKRIRMIC